MKCVLGVFVVRVNHHKDTENTKLAPWVRSVGKFPRDPQGEGFGPAGESPNVINLEKLHAGMRGILLVHKFWRHHMAGLSAKLDRFHVLDR